MSAGAIPVFVARDIIQPFREQFDWPSFSFAFAPTDVWSSMIKTLRAVPPDQLAEMQVRREGGRADDGVRAGGRYEERAGGRSQLVFLYFAQKIGPMLAPHVFCAVGYCCGVPRYCGRHSTQHLAREQTSPLSLLTLVFDELAAEISRGLLGNIRCRCGRLYPDREKDGGGAPTTNRPQGVAISGRAGT